MLRPRRDGSAGIMIGKSGPFETLSLSQLSFLVARNLEPR